MKKIFLFLILAATQLSVAGTPVSETDRLAATCRIWGFLKYYHPQVAKGKFDWDQKLIEVLPLVEKASTKEELSNVFMTWIDGLGNVPVCKRCAKQSNKEIFDKNFDLSWMDDTSLFTRELTAKLRYIEANRHLGNKHYVRSGLLMGGSIKIINEPEYLGLDYSDPHYRLLSLFRYWNVIEYFFPYKYLTDKPWSAVLREIIPKVRDAKDKMAFHMALLEATVAINDSHSTFNNQYTWYYFGYYYAPFEFGIVEDRAIVTGFYDVQKAAKEDIRIGDVITKVNGVAVMDILAKNDKYLSASNDAVKKRESFYSVFNGDTDKVTITGERDGVPFEKDITRYYMRDMVWPSKDVPEKYKILDGNIGYVHMGSITHADVREMINKLSRCKAIIFDIRNYPQGTMYKIGRWLVPESRNFVWFTEPYLDYPGKFKWNKNFYIGSKSSRNYNGKIFLLVNETTQSHAEFTVMGFQAADDVTTIGSQTSGADGNVFQFTLPGGSKAMQTGLGVYYPGGGETQRVGIKVDIEVQPTIEGMRAGKDEVLDKALEIANSK